MPSGSRRLAPVDPLAGRLSELLKSRSFGAIFDIDGTLCPIAPTPQGAHVDHEMRALLRRLTQLLPLVAVISGRDAHKAQNMVGVEGVVCEGNYGLERVHDGQIDDVAGSTRFAPELKYVLHEAKRHLKCPGVLFEDKGVTASIHYRACADRAAVRSQILEAISPLAESKGLRITEGRFVVEIRPPVDVDKGTALAGLVLEFNLDAVMFVGDDCSDVDAFRTLQRLRNEEGIGAIAIGVASPEMPPEIAGHSDYLIEGVPAVKSMIAWMIRELESSEVASSR